MKNKRTQSGFTLIELMIVVAIIGVLASLALPAYSNYTKKAKFAEVVSAGSAVKSSIDVCYQTKGALGSCDEFSELSIAALSVTGGANVASVTIDTTTAGKIEVTGATTVDSATYTLTPTAANGTLTWGAVCSNTAFC
jgi:type IV pilus assembly protein PilA